MSKITNDGLTRSVTGCFIAVPIWQQWASRVKSLCLYRESQKPPPLLVTRRLVVRVCEAVAVLEVAAVLGVEEPAGQSLVSSVQRRHRHVLPPPPAIINLVSEAHLVDGLSDGESLAFYGDVWQ